MPVDKDHACLDTTLGSGSIDQYSLSSTIDFIYEHDLSSGSMLGAGSWLEPNGRSKDAEPGGCVLICTDLRSAALLKSAEWHISLGDDGNLPSESDPRWRGWEQVTVEMVELWEAFELEEGAEDNKFCGLWCLCGETGLLGTLSGWDEQLCTGVSQNLKSSESSDMGEYCKDISSLKGNMLSDLAGDSMRLSGSESPTVNPLRLDAIISLR